LHVDEQLKAAYRSIRNQFADAIRIKALEGNQGLQSRWKDLPKQPSNNQLAEWRNEWAAAHPAAGNTVEQEALRIIKLLNPAATEHDFVFAVLVVSV
jgi:hypothetical protein